MATKSGARLPVASEQEAAEAKIKDFREVGLAKRFYDLVVKRQELKAQVEAITNDKKTGRLDKINIEIGTMLGATGEKSVMCDEWRITLVDGNRPSINKEKLLELGVPASTIIAATKTSYFSSVLITETEEK